MKIQICSLWNDGKLIGAEAEAMWRHDEAYWHVTLTFCRVCFKNFQLRLIYLITTLRWISHLEIERSIERQFMLKIGYFPCEIWLPCSAHWFCCRCVVTDVTEKLRVPLTKFTRLSPPPPDRVSPRWWMTPINHKHAGNSGNSPN